MESTSPRPNSGVGLRCDRLTRNEPIARGCRLEALLANTSDRTWLSRSIVRLGVRITLASPLILARFDLHS